MAFLILSGEFSVTLPVAFSNKKWGHTMSAKKLSFENGYLQRKGINENIDGVILYGDLDDKNIIKKTAPT